MRNSRLGEHVLLRERDIAVGRDGHPGLLLLGEQEQERSRIARPQLAGADHPSRGQQSTGYQHASGAHNRVIENPRDEAYKRQILDRARMQNCAMSYCDLAADLGQRPIGRSM